MSNSRVDVLLVIERLLGRHLPSAARFGVTLLVLTITGLMLRRRNDPPARQKDRELISAGLATLAIVICIYHNIYDALFAAPAAVAAGRILATSASRTTRRLAVTALCCLTIPAVNYFSSRQFLALVNEKLPGLGSLTTESTAWLILCVTNGICLTAAWCLLLKMVRAKT